MKMRILAVVLIAIATSSPAQEVTVETTQVGKNVFMLTAKGGNVGVMVGSDGTFMIDDQFSNLSPALLEAIKSVGGDEPRFLINTHFHGDHTGGNENFGQLGAVIVSHANVRKRLSVETFIKAFSMTTPPQPHAALPVVTFDSEIEFHINGDTLRAMHVPNAHTDGDSVIHFRQSNVIHAGDIWFNGFFPFIDTDHGGSIRGVIDAVDSILALSDAQTKIIPGHGPLGDKTQLAGYRAMLATAQDRLHVLKAQGKSLQEAVAAKPLADLQAQWGNAIFNSDAWIEIVWDGL